jgi:serine/threonine-protein kinase
MPVTRAKPLQLISRDPSRPDDLVASEPSPTEQLTRILASETFQQADRLKRFLTFVVKEALAGRQDDLKEYVIGVRVFRKEETFDPRTDPIVRVQARRLRAKLARYYREEGLTDALIIDLPKGGYAPLFRPRQATVLRRSAGTTFASRNAIVVERFAGYGQSPGLGTFCDAIQDELIHHLAQLPGVRIFASVGPRANESPEDDRRAAAVIVRGSVRQSGGRFRATVHLVDAMSGRYLWSEIVDANGDGAFDAPERIAAAVSLKLEPEWRRGRGVVSAGAPTQNLAAQNLYRQGRYHLDQRTDDGLRKAVEFFDRALGEGAEFALAHSGLADAYSLLAHYGVLAPADAWPKAAAGATAAVMLDDLSAEAHTSLALVKATQDLDWKGAEHEFLRAISLDPRCATAHHWYAASVLAPLGRLDEALDEVLTAESLDPVSSIVSRDIAVMHFYRRDFEAALERGDHTIELNPHFAPAYWILGVIQEQRREFDEAVAAFQRAIALSPNAPRMYGALGRTLALSGARKGALEMLDKLEGFARHRYVSPMEFAWTHFALGDDAAGFRWLARAYAERCFELFAIKVDPRFDAYRDDPRFQPLVRKLGLEVPGEP